MEPDFSELVRRMAELPTLSVYLVVATISYLEYILPPVPGDVVVVFAGYMAGLGLLDAGLVVLLSTASGAAGFMTLYWLGRRLGAAVPERRRIRFLSAARIDRVRRWMQRWGYALVVANRFFSGARSVVALVAGMGSMPRGMTLSLAAVGALAWAALLTAAGFVVGGQWELVSVYLGRYGLAVTGVLLGALLLQLWRERWRMRNHGA